mmetsp:Transcript_138343/g.240564  ORF Transcript_138343/g.240564 Transcript_138343/m.240564 type:complete len:124 (-) Transcript_138343:684-1055(-)
MRPCLGANTSMHPGLDNQPAAVHYWDGCKAMPTLPVLRLSTLLMLQGTQCYLTLHSHFVAIRVWFASRLPMCQTAQPVDNVTHGGQCHTQHPLFPRVRFRPKLPTGAFDNSMPVAASDSILPT